MQNVFRNFIILIGMLLILVGIFGLSYTYRIDHRTARSLSAYARIDFQASYTGEGRSSCPMSSSTPMALHGR